MGVMFRKTNDGCVEEFLTGNRLKLSTLLTTDCKRLLTQLRGLERLTLNACCNYEALRAQPLRVESARPPVISNEAQANTGAADARPAHFRFNDDGTLMPNVIDDATSGRPGSSRATRQGTAIPGLRVHDTVVFLVVHRKPCEGKADARGRAYTVWSVTDLRGSFGALIAYGTASDSLVAACAAADSTSGRAAYRGRAVEHYAASRACPIAGELWAVVKPTLLPVRAPTIDKTPVAAVGCCGLKSGVNRSFKVEIADQLLRIGKTAGFHLCAASLHSGSPCGIPIDQFHQKTLLCPLHQHKKDEEVRAGGYYDQTLEIDGAQVVVLGPTRIGSSYGTQLHIDGTNPLSEDRNAAVSNTQRSPPSAQPLPQPSMPLAELRRLKRLRAQAYQLKEFPKRAKLAGDRTGSHNAVTRRDSENSSQALLSSQAGSVYGKGTPVQAGEIADVVPATGPPLNFNPKNVAVRVAVVAIDDFVALLKKFEGAAAKANFGPNRGTPAPSSINAPLGPTLPLAVAPLTGHDEAGATTLSTLSGQTVTVGSCTAPPRATVDSMPQSVKTLSDANGTVAPSIAQGEVTAVARSVSDATGAPAADDEHPPPRGPDLSYWPLARISVTGKKLLGMLRSLQFGGDNVPQAPRTDEQRICSLLPDRPELAQPGGEQAPLPLQLDNNEETVEPRHPAEESMAAGKDASSERSDQARILAARRSSPGGGDVDPEAASKYCEPKQQQQLQNEALDRQGTTTGENTSRSCYQVSDHCLDSFSRALRQLTCTIGEATATFDAHQRHTATPVALSRGGSGSSDTSGGRTLEKVQRLLLDLSGVAFTTRRRLANYRNAPKVPKALLLPTRLARVGSSTTTSVCNSSDYHVPQTSTKTVK